MARIDEALSFIRRVFGFPSFRPGQEEVLEAVLSGEDVLAVMPTGGGKSLLYQVPAFLGPGLTVVVSPLISLMKDQVDSLRALGLPAAAVHSLMSAKERDEALEEVSSGRARLVYASPERLANRAFLGALAGRGVTLAAVDEAHCISQWGHDFRPEYLKLGRALARLGSPQAMALTATATERVRVDIVGRLGLRTPRRFVRGFDRPNLFWEVAGVSGEGEKLRAVRRMLARLGKRAAIVYAGTRRSVERVAGYLRKSGLAAEAYHAGLGEEERTRVQNAFMEGRCGVVAATNAFGMGIDRPDIGMVIHHTFPGSIEAYYQESGRCGRDGEPSSCVLLYDPADRGLHEFFVESRYPPKETVLAVYAALLARRQDPVWLTYREIAALAGNGIAEPAVASSIRILEQAKAVRRLHRAENHAELYLHADPARMLAGLGPRSKAGRSLLDALLRLFGEERLREGVNFAPEDLARGAGTSPASLRAFLAEAASRGEWTYIPPFRGRGVRILERRKPAELGVDFQSLALRKARELEKMEAVAAYASSEGCRRAFLLRYFGEGMRGTSCPACDACRRARERARSKPPRRPAEERAPRRAGRSEQNLLPALRSLRARIARSEGLAPYCVFQDRILREMARRLPASREEMLAIAGVGEESFRAYGSRFLRLIAGRGEGR